MQARKIVAMMAMAVVMAACGDVATSVTPAGPSFHHVTSYITGPVYTTCSGWHEYDSNPGGGTSYTYAWSYRPYGDSNWYALGTTRTVQQWIDVGDPYMDLRVDVTDSGHTSTSTLRVYGPTNNNIC